MSGIIRRRNFFLDEEEIVAETNRLQKERELEAQRIKDQALEEAERYREQVKKKQDLDQLVNKGFAWLTGLSDDEKPSPPPAPDIFEEDSLYLDNWLFQFEFIEHKLQEEIVDKELEIFESSNFRDKIDEITNYGIFKLGLHEDKIFDGLIKLSAFKISVNYFIEKLKSNQYMDQTNSTFQPKQNQILAVLVNSNNINTRKKLLDNKNFIYYQDVYNQEDINYVLNYKYSVESFTDFNNRRNVIMNRALQFNKIVVFDHKKVFLVLTQPLPTGNKCVIVDPPLFVNVRGDIIKRSPLWSDSNSFNRIRRIEDSFNIVGRIAGVFSDYKLIDKKEIKFKLLTNEKITKFLNT